MAVVRPLRFTSRCKDYPFGRDLQNITLLFVVKHSERASHHPIPPTGQSIRRRVVYDGFMMTP
jgi:hypothetical protein